MKTIVYFHGYGSSCQSNSATCLAKNMPEYNVIAPDIPVDPAEALPFLKNYCAENKVDLIIDCELGIDSLNHLIIGVACHAAQSFWTNSLPDHVSYKRASSIVAGYRFI